MYFPPYRQTGTTIDFEQKDPSNLWAQIAAALLGNVRIR